MNDSTIVKTTTVNVALARERWVVVALLVVASIVPLPNALRIFALPPALVLVVLAITPLVRRPLWRGIAAGGGFIAMGCALLMPFLHVDATDLEHAFAMASSALGGGLAAHWCLIDGAAAARSGRLRRVADWAPLVIAALTLGVATPWYSYYRIDGQYERLLGDLTGLFILFVSMLGGTLALFAASVSRASFRVAWIAGSPIVAFVVMATYEFVSRSHRGGF